MEMKKNSVSPYLEHPQRLADVMAAIQVMAVNKWETRRIEAWQKYLGQQPRSEKNWEVIFRKHPEFFGLEDGYAHLKLRRAYQRHDPQTGQEYTYEEVQNLLAQDPSLKERLTRKPLTQEQLGTLLSAAIELQNQARAFEERARWLVPTIVTSIAGLLGVVIGALLKTS